MCAKANQDKGATPIEKNVIVKTVVSELIPDVAIQKVKAMGEIVIAREETIHKLLDFYLSVYQKLENAEEK